MDDLESGTFCIMHPEPKDIRKYGEVAQQLATLSGKEYGNYAKRRLVFGLN